MTDGVVLESTPEVVNFDWAGRGTSHVDFNSDETLPLLQGRFLGHGMNGGVYETVCQGLPLAWKRRYCRRQIDINERREIEILKKLSHSHIIKLLGTYTHGPFLGLLLWPVAACDLATFMEDVDNLLQGRAADNTDHLPMLHRLKQLDIDTSMDMQFIQASAIIRLKQKIGCTSSAIAYLHQNHIRHKDIKPSNMLVSAHGLWVTDFGTSTDFSTFGESITQNGERGTPKYFAPEVADFEPNGRSADIFSLGCVFFEMIGLCNRYSLDDMRSLRSEKDCSFHNNLKSILHWFNFSGTRVSTDIDQHLMGIVRQMMSANPEERLTALEIESRFKLIDALAGSGLLIPFWGQCCRPASIINQGPMNFARSLSVIITVGNTHHFNGVRHLWTFFVKPSIESLIDKIHVFLVCKIFYCRPLISTSALPLSFPILIC